MPFKDRADAGRELAKALARYKDEQPVLLALPRGGVSVAAEVAAVLKAPLDLILKQFPAYLNRWDSQQARNEGVFAH